MAKPPQRNNPKKIIIPRNRLAVPVIVSTDEIGNPIPKTWGFIPRASRQYRRLLEEVRKDPRWIEDFNKLKRARRAVARKSKFFMKVTTMIQLEVRKRLKELGIRVEEPIQDLGEYRQTHSRLELFKRDRFKDIYDTALHPTKQERELLIHKRGLIRLEKNMIETLFRMHSNRIAHDHFHGGNWAVDKQLNVKVLDLTQARIGRKDPSMMREDEFIIHFGNDIASTAVAICLLRQEILKTPRTDDERTKTLREVVEKILHFYRYDIPVVKQGLVKVDTIMQLTPAGNWIHFGWA